MILRGGPEIVGKARVLEVSGGYVIDRKHWLIEELGGGFGVRFRFDETRSMSDAVEIRGSQVDARMLIFGI